MLNWEVEYKIRIETLLNFPRRSIQEKNPRRLVNKLLSAAGISEDNAQGLKIVRKINSWPRDEASKATVEF